MDTFLLLIRLKVIILYFRHGSTDREKQMSTLILNVDRDDDFGSKAGIPGPVIGYAECYNAAVKLINVDPEDSDANALFGAIHHYEDLKNKGEEVEVALITGNEEVGEESDEIIAAQIDEVLGSTHYDDLILVTDGAEDDYIIPLITSRIKIRYVKHVIVRHNQNIESVYYYIVRALKDKKLVNKFIIPFGLVFLTYGIVSLSLLVYSVLITKANYIEPNLGAVTFVTIVLGGYFVERGFGLGRMFLRLMRSVKEYAEETRVSFISYVIAASLVFAGVASSYVVTIKNYDNPVDAILVFLSFFTWWFYGAVLAREGGVAIELLLNGKKGISKIIYGLLFSLSIAFIVFGMINYIRYELGFAKFQFAVLNIALLILGIVIAILSSVVHRYYTDDNEVGPMTSLEKTIFENK